MRDASLWRALLGVEKAVIEEIEFDEDGELLIAHVRPRSRARGRCGVCGRPCPGYDRGEGRRRWRALDLGTIQVMLEAHAPRVSCPEHAVVVAAVPWARHDAGHTYVLDEQVAWLATQASKTTVTALMRIAWRTVGSIIARVWADTENLIDRFAGLSRIGIDEISYKRGHKYLTIVVDHDSGRLVWAAPGRDKATLATFFDLLGEERCAAITHVSADGADWIATVVAARCPKAVRCADPFHVVSWATDALDEVRRAAWKHRARRGGQAPGGPRERAREGPQGRPVRVVEEPGEPDRAAAGQARVGGQDRPAAVPGIPAQVGPSADLPAAVQASQRGARAVDLLGPAVPHRGVRETAEEHRQTPRGDPGRDRAQPVQWSDRVGEYEDPFDNPDRVWVPLTRGTDRPRDAQPRRPPTRPPRPKMTHGRVRRAG